LSLGLAGIAYHDSVPLNIRQAALLVFEGVCDCLFGKYQASILRGIIYDVTQTCAAVPGTCMSIFEIPGAFLTL
jgi:hypothetical protein